MEVAGKLTPGLGGGAAWVQEGKLASSVRKGAAVSKIAP